MACYESFVVKSALKPILNPGKKAYLSKYGYSLYVESDEKLCRDHHHFPLNEKERSNI